MLFQDFCLPASFEYVVPLSLGSCGGLSAAEGFVKLGHGYFHVLVSYLGFKFAVGSSPQKLKMSPALREETAELWRSTFGESKSQGHFHDPNDQREDSVASHLSLPFNDGHRDGRMMVNVIQKYKRIKIPEFHGLTEKELRLYCIPVTQDPRPAEWASALRGMRQPRPAAKPRIGPPPSTTELDLFCREGRLESLRAQAPLSRGDRPRLSSKLDSAQRPALFADRSREKAFRVCRRSPGRNPGFSLLEDTSCNHQTDGFLTQSSLYRSNRLLKRDDRRLVSIGTKVTVGLGPIRSPSPPKKPLQTSHGSHKSPPPYSDSLKVRKLRIAKVEFLLTSFPGASANLRKRL